jgi:hypothetical protein
MTTQTRTIEGTTYHFVCLEGRNGYDVIEVMAKGKGSLSYPKFRYERYKQYPWQLLGKSTGESSRILDILGEIWDAAL